MAVPDIAWRFPIRSLNAASGTRLPWSSPTAIEVEAPPAAGVEARRLLWIVDAAVLVLAFFTAHAIAPTLQRLIIPGGPLRLRWLEPLSLPAADSLDRFPPAWQLSWLLLVMMPATLLYLRALGGYREPQSQSRTRVAMVALASPMMGLSFATLTLFTARIPAPSRTFIISFAFLAVTGLSAYRTAVRQYSQRQLATGHYARNVIVIGTKPAVAWLSRYFEQHVPQNLYHLSGWLPLVPNGNGNLAGLECLGSAPDLANILIRRPIHEVIAIQSSGDAKWLRKVVETCDYFRVTLRIIPEALLAGNVRDLRPLFRSDPLHLPQIVLTAVEAGTKGLLIKRLFDVVVSATLLVVLSPLFLLIALAIKLTTPDLKVFYPWKVVGYKGQPFTGYKFTTMVADAEERKRELMHLNEMRGPVFKIRNDPRVTPLGRFLRRYSLNELPQLWSVLKGDMSLVGPRPAGPDELERYEPWHKRKLSVQPGITCLWQVNGRNQIADFNEWVRLDLEYIEQRSLWFDCKILVRTVWAVVDGTGC